jgi:hypothetical protein
VLQFTTSEKNAHFSKFDIDLLTLIGILKNVRTILISPIKSTTTTDINRTLGRNMKMPIRSSIKTNAIKLTYFIISRSVSNGAKGAQYKCLGPDREQ